MPSLASKLRRWKERLHLVPADDPERSRGDLGFRRLAAEVEEGLRDIDFDEVTTEDRIAFVECAVAWQVRRALRSGRFDLALELQRFGGERVAELELKARRAVFG